MVLYDRPGAKTPASELGVAFHSPSLAPTPLIFRLSWSSAHLIPGLSIFLWDNFC